MTSPLSINCSRQDSSVKYAISGRIDTVTAPQLSANIHVEDASELIIDLTEVDYVSSAGLRVFLQTQAEINKAGEPCALSTADPTSKSSSKSWASTPSWRSAERTVPFHGVNSS